MDDISDRIFSYGIYASALGLGVSLPANHWESLISPQDLLAYVSIAAILVRVFIDVCKYRRDRKNESDSQSNQ